MPPMTPSPSHAFDAEPGRDDDAFPSIATDPEGFGALLSSDPAALLHHLSRDAAESPAGPAIIDRAAFASAACDVSGHIIAADRGFAWPSHGLSAELRGMNMERPAVSFLIEDRGRLIAVAAARRAHARNWPLAAEVSACLDAGRAQIALVAYRLPTGFVHTASRMAAAFKLTRLEARVVEGLIHGGDARRAATSAGVSYETARDALKSAMRKSGTRSQAGLIALAISIGAGEVPPANARSVLTSRFGLTERQAAVALMVAEGRSRKDAAASLHISEHAVKAALSAVHVALGVSTAAALSSTVARIGALSSFTSASSVHSLSGNDRSALRLIARIDRPGRIAFDDHGPDDGIPCLIIHTATTGRHLPLAHVARLREFGLRPIAIDRPGTGLTDPAPGIHRDNSATDMVEVLDALGIARAVIVARGGAMVLGRFAAEYPDRLARAVALNPEPRPAHDTTFQDYIGQAKRLVFERTRLIDAFAGYLVGRSSTRAIEFLVRRALAASAADMRTLADPKMMADYVHATQQSALQRGAGFIAIAREEPSLPDTPIGDGRSITILAGAEDPLYRLDDSVARWSANWPGCDVRVVPDAGRLLQFQRPELIANLLKGL